MADDVDVQACAGLITAAGASRRMGAPKALLRLPDGTLLARYQDALLRQAGCGRVVTVIGAHADQIAPALTGMDVVENADWTKGRLSSIRMGFRHLGPVPNGCLIMPVDTVGVAVQTVEQVIRAGQERPNRGVVRPVFEKGVGRLAWLSEGVVARFLATTLVDDIPFSRWLEPHTTFLPVHDPAVLHNINTPEEYSLFHQHLLEAQDGTIKSFH